MAWRRHVIIGNMKKTLVSFARKTLKGGALSRVEDAYRKQRIKALSAKYGHPAKSLRVIAVTGTNGKTTTLAYLNEILKESGKKTAMFSTATIEIAGESRLNDLNATVGTTEQMQMFFRDAKQASVDFVLLEVTSHSIHQHKLDGIPIEVAIMTNLTQDHLDYHKTMDEYAAVKARLFARDPDYIVLNRDDEWFDFYNKYNAAKQKITYGVHDDAEAKISDIVLYRKGTEATVTIDHQTKLSLATALPGAFNVSNMTAATAAAYLLGVNLKDIVEGVANLEHVPGRFERATEALPFDVIVDYAHTPDALEKLLTTAKSVTKNRVILVFGACGDRDATKRPIMGKIASEYADRIILTDEENYTEDASVIRLAIREGIVEGKGEGKMTEIADRREAIEKALSIAKQGDTVLITGLGHEVYRIVDGNRVPWNDTEVVNQIIQEKTTASKELR